MCNTYGEQPALWQIFITTNQIISIYKARNL